MYRQNLIADIMAGLSVTFVALALGAALGTMSGRGAFAGMISAAIIPIITSIFGGTRIQASGPTAPMTAVSALLVANAYDNFHNQLLVEQFVTLVFLLCGLLIFLFGLFGLGKLIRLVPNVVVLGFMNGIAALIWVDQLSKLFGYSKSGILKGDFVANILVATTTFGLILAIPYLLKKFKARKSIQSFLPGVFVGILIMTIITTAFAPDLERISLGANGNSFADFSRSIKNYFPGLQILKLDYITLALPYAFKLAVLAYLDSLLTALVVDQITHEKSKLNKELLAQGLANTASAIAQGIPGAQATIRSVLLIKEGARTRLAGVLIGLFSILGIIVLKDYLATIAAAVFIGVLLKAGLDVFDFSFPNLYLQEKGYAQKNFNIQLGFILYTTLVTITIDLNVAVISGTVLYYLGVRYFHVTDFHPEGINAHQTEQEVMIVPKYELVSNETEMKLDNEPVVLRNDISIPPTK